MNTHSLKRFNTPLAVAIAAALFTACSNAPAKPEGADNVRTKLTQLQADPKLAGHAPVEIKDAESAVRAAEEPNKDIDASRHLVLIADRKVDIAAAQAQTRSLEDQRKALSEQQQTARLDARTQEADKAHRETTAAQGDANVARADANVARADADAARVDTVIATQQSAQLQLDAKKDAYELKRQIDELNAKATERGLVVTLGDVLFATGQSDLKGGAQNNLSKLASFLNRYRDSSVVIEGHTDNVGSDDMNLGLSQRRADAVKSYLMGQGVSQARLSSSGKGEGTPIAGNDSATGRQQNRRVEVVIANPPASAAAVSVR